MKADPHCRSKGLACDLASELAEQRDANTHAFLKCRNVRGRWKGRGKLQKRKERKEITVFS